MPPSQGSRMRRVQQCDEHKGLDRHASLLCRHCRLQCNKCKGDFAMSDFHRDRGWVKPLCSKCQTVKVKRAKDDAQFRKHTALGQALGIKMYHEALESIKPGMAKWYNHTLTTWDEIAKQTGFPPEDVDRQAYDYSKMLHGLLKGRKLSADMLNKDFILAWETAPTIDRMSFKTNTPAETMSMCDAYCLERLRSVHFVAKGEVHPPCRAETVAAHA